MEKLNWGIIGLGSIAQKFAEGFNDTDNAKLLAAASQNPKRLSSFEEKFKLDKKYLFNNYDKLINCKDVDIVYIALPNAYHYDWTIKSIENNKNVLVEKPATINFKEAKNIENLLLSKDIFFGEAFMYRYHPQISLLLNIIKNDEIGNPLSMHSYFGTNILTKKKLFFFNKKKKIDKKNRLFNKYLGGGCILDLGCYPSSLSILISSLINTSNKKNYKLTNVHKEVGETLVDIHSYAELIFEKNFVSKIGASFKENLGMESRIIGEKGSIILNNTWLGSQNLVKIKDNMKHVLDVNSEKNIYSYQIQNISKNILNGINKPIYPGMTIQETLFNMRIMEDWLNV